MSVTIQRQAETLLACDLSVVPVTADTKKAVGSWKSLQTCPMERSEIPKRFAKADAIAVAGGHSGVECIDFDDPTLLEPWACTVRGAIGAEVLASLCLQETPSGGYHVVYRCSVVEGNQKLAMQASGEVGIETRGDGGYFLVHPSAGYELLQGSLASLPTITPDQRAVMLGAARALSAIEQEEIPSGSPPPPSTGPRPGDLYNEREGWRNILEAQGWTWVKDDGRRGYYKRPGNTKAEWSATTGNGLSGQNLLYVFTSSVPGLEPGHCYSKFHFTVIHEYGGDWKAATKAIAQRYGIAKAPPIAPPAGDVPPAGGAEEPKEFPWTDSGNAERLLSRFGEDLLHVAALGSWLVWNGSVWVRDDTRGAPVSRMALETARSMYARGVVEDDEALQKYARACESRSRIDAMVALAQRADSVAVAADGMDSHQMILCVQNGVIDLENSKLLPHDRALRCSKIVDIPYVPDAVCPRWERFLEEVLVDPDLIAYVHRMIGYCLTGLTIEQKLFFNYGLGANGKSVYLEVLAALLGEYCRQASSDSLMVKHGEGIPNDIARLQGARIVITSEVEESRRLNESLVKTLTGGDVVTARFLNQEFFEFRPRFKLQLYGNHRPRIRGLDEGVWRRIAPIPFTVTIPEAQRDPHLPQKLAAELPGIMAWAVRGCALWQAEGLGRCAAVEHAADEYREEMDPLQDFLETRCLIGAEHSAPARDLWRAYKAFAEESGAFVGDEKRFKAMMIRAGLAWKRTHASRVYAGVALRGWDGT